MQHCCPDTASLLRVTASVEKREGRKEARIRKDHESKLLKNKILLEEDYECSKATADSELRNIFIFKKPVCKRVTTQDLKHNIACKVSAIKRCAHSSEVVH